MQRNWVVLFCLLTVVFLSGCTAILYPKGAKKTTSWDIKMACGLHPILLKGFLLG